MFFFLWEWPFSLDGWRRLFHYSPAPPASCTRSCTHPQECRKILISTMRCANKNASRFGLNCWPNYCIIKFFLYTYKVCKRHFSVAYLVNAVLYIWYFCNFFTCTYYTVVINSGKFTTGNVNRNQFIYIWNDTFKIFKGSVAEPHQFDLAEARKNDAAPTPIFLSPCAK
jgi:hypothetical protein